jgi:hypothetical protein
MLPRLPGPRGILNHMRMPALGDDPGGVRRIHRQRVAEVAVGDAGGWGCGGGAGLGVASGLWVGDLVDDG